MTAFVVRKGRVEDVAAVMALERGVAEAPHWGEGSYRAIFAGAGAGVERAMFVAEAAGEVVGFSVGMATAGVGELESVAVADGARRAGVGRALCGAVEMWCGEQGARVMELEVREGSGPAVAMYRAMGFMEEGRRRGYYGEPREDALLMRKVLREVGMGPGG